jgi:predicted metallo-beta-lactamase superfamily hydrolase
MRVAVIGTESLGVRGLCCMVEAGTRRFLIDPGVALGYRRRGLLPHPCQVAVGAAVREAIVSSFTAATDVVLSHYHGDHIPLADANPYQLALGRIPPLAGVSLWCKGSAGISFRSRARKDELVKYTRATSIDAEGMEGPELSFSGPIPHGPPGSHLGMVMMTCIREGDCSFVHASDIQMLNREAVDRITAWAPDLVIASGPPLYLNHIAEKQRDFAWNAALDLAGNVGLLVLDHHLLRSQEGFSWLERLSAEAGGNVVSAAELMGTRTGILEARRDELYAALPVPQGWHAAYARGEVDFWNFVDADLEGEMARLRAPCSVAVQRGK